MDKTELMEVISFRIAEALDTFSPDGKLKAPGYQELLFAAYDIRAVLLDEYRTDREETHQS